MFLIAAPFSPPAEPGAFELRRQDPVGSASLGGFIMLTDAGVDDIVAYLNLLGPMRDR